MTRDVLSDAVAAAVRESPATLRALAREASVPDSTLVRIVAGERAATPAVAEAIAKACERWSKTSHRGAQRIRLALRKGER